MQYLYNLFILLIYLCLSLFLVLLHVRAFSAFFLAAVLLPFLHNFLFISELFPYNSMSQQESSAGGGSGGNDINGSVRHIYIQYIYIYIYPPFLWDLKWN
jgi:hypothetical protein